MTRLATLSIFVEDKNSIAFVNDILSDFSNIIISRMGIPYLEKKYQLLF